MKYKYYAMINGKETLVRTTAKDYYNYMCVATNQCCRTYDELLSRIHSEIFVGYNGIKKSGYCYKRIDNELRMVFKDKASYEYLLRRCYLPYDVIIDSEIYNEDLNEKLEHAQTEYEKCVKTIIEIYHY